MLYAETDSEFISIIFGRIGSDGNITVGPVATDSRFRNNGIARKMMSELEKRVASRGIHMLSFGAAQSAEGF